jgi:hypothetical protein
MKTCIICRKDKTEFNDEHVIPDSIGGYYHIYSVCTTCNSNLGIKIDCTVTNHHLIEWARFVLGIKGKSGTIPNPLRLDTTLADNPDQKVIMKVQGGKFSPYYIPNVPKYESGAFPSHFTISGDGRDEKKLEKIMETILNRQKIDKSKVTISKSIKTDKRSYVTPFILDMHKFKAGILKIAYEFAVDQIPEYLEDSQAKIISEILFKADFQNLTKKVLFYGNGFDKTILIPFQHLIEFENNNHYLVLHSNEDGLFCLVNLFTTFSIMIKLSEKVDYIENNLIIGKNDLEKRSFTVYDAEKMVNTIFTFPEYRFEYFFQDQQSLNEFWALQNSGKFTVFMQNDMIPIFSKDGQVIYDDVDKKLRSVEPKTRDSTDANVNIYEFDEEMYVKEITSGKLYQVVGLSLEQNRVSKL